MSAVEIPELLPSAITLPDTVIEFPIEQHLEESGDTSSIAFTWPWVPHRGHSVPISRRE